MKKKKEPSNSTDPIERAYFVARSVCGQMLFYPLYCNADALCRLAGRKCFRVEDIRILEEMNFPILLRYHSSFYTSRDCTALDSFLSQDFSSFHNHPLNEPDER